MSNKDEALKLALETSEGIVNADWRKWDELASPSEFERWAKSRANFMATILREALAEQHEMTNIERHERNVKKFLAEQPAQQEPVDSTQISKVWWDGQKLMAHPIPWEQFYKEPEQTAQRDIRNATLDEIATKIEQDFKGAFGADTCASWAAWIRNQKCEK